ncbi:MAG: hypothetical protein JNK84_13375 [Phreatobacter sp.]|uniref:hypothetical protein n=1 Tax=Phreatobacter sp. TaxID=1966341 RepID=UPI001A452A4C|nr:hypothetical protein [Phreatobacter sp.]MBL8570055.1 hypothetical protein [Phreatobacter sp.]
MSTSNPTFTTAKASAADAHTLALIASSLVAATAVAFVAMVFTAWPAKASERMRMAALPAALVQGEAASPVSISPAPAPSRAAAPAPVAPVRTAALGTLPMPAQPCTEALAAAETEMNATLAKVEALSEAEMGAQCSAFRVHMSSLQRAASTVDRCVAGQDRSTKAGFIRQSMAEWRGVIANGCR